MTGKLITYIIAPAGVTVPFAPYAMFRADEGAIAEPTTRRARVFANSPTEYASRVLVRDPLALASLGIAPPLAHSFLFIAESVSLC